MFKTRWKSVVKLPNFARCQFDASSAARLTRVAKPLYDSIHFTADPHLSRDSWHAKWAAECKLLQDCFTVQICAMNDFAIKIDLRLRTSIVEQLVTLRMQGLWTSTITLDWLFDKFPVFSRSVCDFAYSRTFPGPGSVILKSKDFSRKSRIVGALYDICNVFTNMFNVALIMMGQSIVVVGFTWTEIWVLENLEGYQLW